MGGSWGAALAVATVNSSLRAADTWTRCPLAHGMQGSRPTAGAKLPDHPRGPPGPTPAHGWRIFRRATERVCGALWTMGDHTDTWKPRKRSYINFGAKNVLHGNTTFSISN